MSAISRLGGSFEPRTRRQPTLLPRRERVARYIIRLDLDGSTPRIWRRIELPSDLTLDRVHSVLQAAMGWTESHLHAFEMGPKRDHRIQRFLTEYDLEEGEDEGIPETDVRLDETLAMPGDRLFYEYDFGDGWDHTLKLEQVDNPRDEPVEVRVSGGRRACPPEDVGGIGAYNELVAALVTGAPAEDEWLQDRLDWLPTGFDPTEFDQTQATEAASAAAAGQRSPMELPFTHPELIEMLLALGCGTVLDDLIVRAGAGSTGLSPEEIEAAVRPITQLLNLIGDSGAELTAAGYLKPALVEQLAQRTGVTTWWWIGKANREDQTPPIAALRSAAQSLGLVRKQRQRLLLTAAGRRARGDPAALWEVLVAGLPVGRRPEQRQAGLLALLTVAAGRPAYPLNEGTEVMRYLGWHNDVGQITPEAVYHFARRTLEVLEALDPAEYRVLPGSAAALARAALRPALPVG